MCPASLEAGLAVPKARHSIKHIEEFLFNTRLIKKLLCALPLAQHILFKNSFMCFPASLEAAVVVVASLQLQLAQELVIG